MKRLLCLLSAILLCFLTPLAQADMPQTPTRRTFMLSQDRIQEAFVRGIPVYWRVSATPEATKGYELSALSLLQSIVSKMALSGTIQSDSDGAGYMDIAVLMNQQRISSFSQMARDGRVGMQMNSEWFSLSQDENDIAMASALLSFDALGQSLLSFPYAQIHSLQTPFVSPISHLGVQLWALASPWSADNNYITARSGATSHGITYTIDTYAAQSILNQWTGLLSVEPFQYGLPGTDFFIGIDEASFARFTDRMRRLSQVIELPNKMNIDVAYGEGDEVSYVRGSGSVKVDGKRSDISIRYTRDASKSRIKYRLTIDFQPNASDTLKLDLSVSTSSNEESKGAYSVEFDAHGLFDGIPYQISYHNELENQYLLADDRTLTENIAGKADASIQYNERMVAEIAYHQESVGVSALGKKGILVQHTYNTTLQNDEGLLFSGPVTFWLEMKEDTGEPPSMDNTLYIETMDLLELEALRESITNAQATFKQNIWDALSPAANISQRGAQ